MAWGVATVLALISTQAAAFEAFPSLEVPRHIRTGEVRSTVTVDTHGRLIIGKITLSVYIKHSYPADLVISLIHPDGTRVYMTRACRGSATYTGNRNVNPDWGFGTGKLFPEMCTFDDGALVDEVNKIPKWAFGTSVTGPGHIPGGLYAPYDGDLADFANKVADGKWTLVVQDLDTVDFGELISWQLNIDQVTERVWTGAANDNLLSNGGNWRDGLAPLHGEGAANLVFPAQATLTTLTNDVVRLTVGKLTMGGNVVIGPDVRRQLWRPTLCLANDALVYISGERNTILPNSMGPLMPPNGPLLSPMPLWGPPAALELRGLAKFFVASGNTFTINNNVNDYVYEWYRLLVYIGMFPQYWSPLYTMRRATDIVGESDNDEEILIQRRGNIVKGDPGTMVLGGTNYYTGHTTVNDGVLRSTSRRSLGVWDYFDRFGNLVVVDQGTDIDGGRVELGYTGTFYVNATSDGELSEISLLVKSLGFENRGALMVAPYAGIGQAIVITGPVTLNYLSGKIRADDDDDNELSPHAVGIGAFTGCRLIFHPRMDGYSNSFNGHPTIIRIMGGGDIDWSGPVPSHLTVSDTGTLCTFIQPDIVPDNKSLTVINNATVVYAGFNTIAPHPAADVTLTYVDRVNRLRMGGGLLKILQNAPPVPPGVALMNGVLAVNEGRVSTYDWEPGYSQIVGAIDFGVPPTIDTGLNLAFGQHLVIGAYPSDPDYANSRSAILGGTPLTKIGNGTCTLAQSCVFLGDATINAGGLTVNNTMRSVDKGRVATGFITVNDGYCGGTGTVAGIMVKKGGVDPGDPIPAALAAPNNPIGVPGVLNCDSVFFATEESMFTVDLYSDGTCDQLRVGAETLDPRSGDVILGDQFRGNCRLVPMWRGPVAPTGQWFVIINDQPNTSPYTKTPIMSFTGLPPTPGSSTIDYSYNVAPYDGNDVAIRITGTVSFAPSPTGETYAVDNSPLYTFPELNADGSPVTAELRLNASGTGKVTYYTTGWTALGGLDFVPTIGDITVTSTTGSVSVPILYNQTITPSRFFFTKLASPTAGMALSQPVSATVVITDINTKEEEKSSGCGMSSGYAVFLFFALGLLRLATLRRRNEGGPRPGF
jgi:autotransporter-associated beta strand protein